MPTLVHRDIIIIVAIHCCSDDTTTAANQFACDSDAWPTGGGATTDLWREDIQRPADVLLAGHQPYAAAGCPPPQCPPADGVQRESQGRLQVLVPGATETNQL